LSYTPKPVWVYNRFFNNLVPATDSSTATLLQLVHNY